MSINRNDLVKQRQEASAILLEEKGYVSFVDVRLRMGRSRKMFVSILWNDRRFSVPLDQLQCVRCDRKIKQAIEDWHYWVRQGYQFG